MAKEDECSFSAWDGLQGEGSGDSEVPVGNNGNWKSPKEGRDGSVLQRAC